MTDDLPEDETIGFGVLRGHQPTFVGVDQDILIRALSAAEEAKDFAHELLAIHDENLGRTLKRHRMMAEELEKSIAKSDAVQVELRKAMGWPQK
jgi:hypothetical protein